MSGINSVKNCKDSILVKKNRGIRKTKKKTKKSVLDQQLYILLTCIGYIFYFVLIDLYINIDA